MKEQSRTKNSIKNSTASIITQVLTVLMDFAVKTVFIRILSTEYLGINGLFANIITLLSLADLGIGIAIPYSLYKPLAEKDEKKIKGLMNYYSKIYSIIGVIVLIIGLSLTPFLSYIIKDMPNIKNIYFIYMLFVTHSALSYLFVYKRFLIESDQKGYIISKINFICALLLNITRVLLLVITKNFILYLFCSLIFIIIQNGWYSKKANKLYPYIKNKNKEEIDKDELKEINKNIKALFIYKIGNVIANGTDNIIISKFLGLSLVGLLSNYILITNSLGNILIQVFNTITSSIGNLVATNNERSKNIYEKLFFFNFYIYSLCGICLFILINPFIYLWIGNKYILGFDVAFILGINFYTSGIGNVTNSFRTAYGLFYKAKYRPILMIVINIIISLLLVKPLGIFGVILGTIISRLLTTSWLDPYIVYKYGFKSNPILYYIKYVYYLLIFLISGVFINYITSYIIVNNIFNWTLLAISTFILYNLIIILIFRKKEEFKFFAEKGLKFLTKKLNRV